MNEERIGDQNYLNAIMAFKLLWLLVILPPILAMVFYLIYPFKNVSSILGLLIAYIVLIGYILRTIHVEGRGLFSSIGLAWTINRKVVSFSAFLFLLCLNVFFEQVYLDYLEFDPQSELGKLIANAVLDSAMPISILVLLTVTLIGPFTEELIFRGYLQSLLRKKLNSRFLIIAISATVFSVMHLDIYSFPLLLLGGFSLGLLFEVSESLLLPFLLHVNINALSVVKYFV